MTAADLARTVTRETGRTLVVACGAVFGACARFGLQGLSPGSLWPLLGINLLACLAMGFFRPGLFWGKGVLGGFSSFSAVVVVFYHVPAWEAVAYLAATVLGGFAAWCVGDVLAERRTWCHHCTSGPDAAARRVRAAEQARAHRTVHHRRPEGRAK
ncbi:CrcB family protein [Corynebacterium frankenforstense]|uniref:CrcB family protein n=1 Tax=Corynebacterium frankenforstense TaxID=1230998 RepID=UPI0026F0AF35|nr:CrcB family protein [Corynebacterium frankenforstense]